VINKIIKAKISETEPKERENTELMQIIDVTRITNFRNDIQSTVQMIKKNFTKKF